MNENQKTEFRKVFDRVHQNRLTLRACKLHTIAPTTYRFGQKLTCLNCDGEIRGEEISAYIDGYEAHGGNADDIWPGYRKKTDAPTV